jgi:hypothetical protein
VGPQQPAFPAQAICFPRGAFADLLDAYYYAKRVMLGTEPMFADLGTAQRAAEEAERRLREHPHVSAPKFGSPRPGEWTQRDILTGG